MTALTNTTINSLEDLRAVTQQFFDDQKVTAKQIISVQTQELPARIIAFQYYGSSELGSNIAQLNTDINVSNLQGNIDILTA